MSDPAPSRCPNCLQSLEPHAKVCPACNRPIPGQSLEYFSGADTEETDQIPLQNRWSILAILFSATAVAVAMAGGLTEPGPLLRRLSACAAALMAGGGLIAGAIALRRWPLPYIDRCLAVIAIGLGTLCLAAAARLFFKDLI